MQVLGICGAGRTGPIFNLRSVLAVPGLVNRSDLAAVADAITKIVLKSVPALLHKLALQMAGDDYDLCRECQLQDVQLAKSAGEHAGRVANTPIHRRIAPFGLNLAGSGG